MKIFQVTGHFRKRMYINKRDDIQDIWYLGKHINIIYIM
jgi:hypothetical protein